jgi:ornithine cyclodeaminase/alanine dehydrogenase-like protein (mu-crystallin family)
MEELRYLSRNDVRQALPMADAVAAMRAAFIELSCGDALVPPRLRMDLPGEKGIVLTMPCASGAEKLVSVKLVSLFDGNRAKGLPLIHALVVLADATTGAPCAIMDGASLTAIRTGAGSGAATDALARRDAETAAVFGAGTQARTQLEAVACVRRLRRARVFDPDQAAAERFAAEMTALLGFTVERAATSAEALEDAAVVCTATTSPAPVFRDRELAPGTHINAVGSYKPEVTEIPPETVRRARIIVDHRASALEEAGDLLVPLGRGMILEDDLRTEIGEVLASRTPGRTSKAEVTLFKSVGVAIQDLYAGARALANARAGGLGTVLSR